jgi:hypothetical protein
MGATVATTRCMARMFTQNRSLVGIMESCLGVYVREEVECSHKRWRVSRAGSWLLR